MITRIRNGRGVYVENLVGANLDPSMQPNANPLI